MAGRSCGEGRWGIPGGNTAMLVSLLQDLTETLISYSWTLDLHCALRGDGKGMWGQSVGRLGRRLVLESWIRVFCHHYFLRALKGPCWYSRVWLQRDFS